MLRPRNPSTSYVFVAALAFLFHTQALILPSPSNETTPKPFTNLTSTYTQCVANSKWNPGSREMAPECENALMAFADDASTWGPNLGTFSYNEGSSSARFQGVGKTLEIPKRYVSDHCVVAVVMMKLFEGKPEWQFPDLLKPRSPWPEEDETTWVDMVQKMAYVRSTCRNGCGYALVGKHAGIGLVTWATNSKWDEYIQGMNMDDGEDNVSGDVSIS